jgi:hypothetical protein
MGERRRVMWEESADGSIDLVWWVGELVKMDVMIKRRVDSGEL